MDRLKEVVFKPKKVFWKGKSGQPYSFICPLCTSQRKIPYQPKPTPRHYLQIALTSACLTLAMWPIFGVKGMVCFIPIWTTFEVLYRGRVRGALNCPHCGFDPYLYMIDVPRARTEIDAHWRRKFAEKGVPFPEKPVAPLPDLPPSSGVLLASSVRSSDAGSGPRAR